MSWVAVAVGGASLVGGYMSSKGAKDASKAQVAGADAQAKAAERQAQIQWDMFNQARSDNEPFRQAGLTGIQEYMAFLGLPTQGVSTAAASTLGSPGSANSSQFFQDGQMNQSLYNSDPIYRQAWDAVAGHHGYAPGTATAFSKGEDMSRIVPHMQSAYDLFKQRAAAAAPQQPAATGGGTSLTQKQAFDRFRSQPGYQFGLTEGQKALSTSASAAGGLFSGKAGKELVKFGQNYADQQGVNPYMNRLAALAGIGQTATSQNNAAGQSAASGIGNAYANMGNAAASAANARASGIQGSANAWGNTLGQLAGIGGYMYGNRWGGV